MPRWGSSSQPHGSAQPWRSPWPPALPHGDAGSGCFVPLRHKKQAQGDAAFLPGGTGLKPRDKRDQPRHGA